ncbi:sigma-70 family RNA polymerase sigma factor [Streptomyces sp. NPDC101110]|uniref:sigma-70 family RNA polymerase sigma factor n=1 Tax=Streptomyces sp. NPDC101110 TaxID=3366104 RepID=UPI0037F438B8
MSVDGRDESGGGGHGDAAAGDPAPPQVPSQGGRASVPPSGHPADGSVPAQRDGREDGALPPELPTSDAGLIDRMRAGDDTAYEELYRRHAQAVRRYARTCCRDAHTADDLTAEVFARMLQAVRGGAGPTHAVRAYLLTSVRRVAAAWTRSARREQLVDDFAVFAAQSAHGPDVSGDDTLELGADVRAMHEAEQSMAMRAFRSLPERWQAVLWHTEVEDETPSEVATLFGLDANGTRVLASRAREGLKQAYLQAHVSATLTGDKGCARYADQLGTYARGRLRTRAERGLRKHLEECAKCRLAALQIEEVAGGIPAVVPVAVIGWFGAAGYAKAAGLIAGGAGVAGAAGAAATAGGAAGGAATAGGGAAGGTAVGGSAAGSSAVGGGAAGSSAVGGGAAGGGAAGGGGGVAASEGIGAPVKAGIAAGVVAVGVVATVVMGLAGNDKPKDEAKADTASPAPSSVVHPGDSTPPPPSPPETGPRSRPSGIMPPRATTPTPTPTSTPTSTPTPTPSTTPSPDPDPDPATPSPTPTRTPGPPASPGPTPPPDRTPTPTPSPSPPAPAVYRWSELSYDVNGDGTKPEMRIGSSGWVWKRSGLRVGGERYGHGVTVHGRSSVTIDLNRSCSSYDALVGVDDMTLRLGAVRFSVYADGTRLWRSPLVEGGDAAVPVHVDLTGRSTVRLVVEPRGVLDALMAVDWAESRFTCG